MGALIRDNTEIVKPTNYKHAMKHKRKGEQKTEHINNSLTKFIRRVEQNTVKQEQKIMILIVKLTNWNHAMKHKQESRKQKKESKGWKKK